MKRTQLFWYCLLVACLFSFSQCKKENEEPQLPPETTTGAMTFGCKVNGEVFVPQDGGGRPGLFVQYVNAGSGPGGGWYLNMPAYNYRTKSGVSIETDSLLLEEGVSYQFKRKKGFPLAWYEEVDNGLLHVYGKLDSNSGILQITRHDKVKRILSGKFEFVGTKVVTGESIGITEGRFDIRY